MMFASSGASYVPTTTYDDQNDYRTNPMTTLSSSFTPPNFNPNARSIMRGHSQHIVNAAQIPRRTHVDAQLYNVEQILNELVKRNEVMSGPSRKRKASLDENVGLLSPQAKEQFRQYLMQQAGEESDSNSSEDESNSPTEYTAVGYPEEQLQLSKVHKNQSSHAPPPLYNVEYTAKESIPQFKNVLPIIPAQLFDDIQIPLRGFSPTTRTIAPPRPRQMERPTNQQLFQAYINVTAKRIGYLSPSYVALFTKYIPAMAQQAPALMEAILAIAALQVGMMKEDDHLVSVEAANHYSQALMMHGVALANSNTRTADATLATALTMVDFELWSGENVKMGVHMLGARDIVVARGKAANMTPVGRALFACFRRFDTGSSAISGNPCFLTNDWWTVDPLSRIPIDEDSPPLLATDAALAKITIIASKLSYVKAWATRRRRDLWVQSKGQMTGRFLEKKLRLQESIVRKIERLCTLIAEWKTELPSWFRPLPDNAFTGGENNEEDVNRTSVHVFLPLKYKHWCLATAECWAISLQLQMYRVKFPDAPVADAENGALVHRMMRIFATLPPDSDQMLMGCVFFGGMELRQKPHQMWFVNEMQKHLMANKFPGFMFVLQGCKFAWMKLDGMNSGRFTRIKEGAAARIDGVSENLWSAEGVLGSLEALSLYDSPDTAGQRKNFQGDFEDGIIVEDEDNDAANSSSEDQTLNPPQSAKRQAPDDSHHYTPARNPSTSSVEGHTPRSSPPTRPIPPSRDSSNSISPTATRGPAPAIRVPSTSRQSLSNEQPNKKKFRSDESWVQAKQQ